MATKTAKIKDDEGEKKENQGRKSVEDLTIHRTQKGNPTFSVLRKWPTDSGIWAGLGPVPFAVYCMRNQLSDGKTLLCKYSQQKIGELLNCTRKTVAAADKKLVEAGLLVKFANYAPGKQGTIYKLINDPASEWAALSEQAEREAQEAQENQDEQWVNVTHPVGKCYPPSASSVPTQWVNATHNQESLQQSNQQLLTTDDKTEKASCCDNLKFPSLEDTETKVQELTEKWLKAKPYCKEDKIRKQIAAAVTEYGAALVERTIGDFGTVANAFELIEFHLKKRAKEQSDSKAEVKRQQESQERSTAERATRQSEREAAEAKQERIRWLMTNCKDLTPEQLDELKGISPLQWELVMKRKPATEAEKHDACQVAKAEVAKAELKSTPGFIGKGRPKSKPIPQDVKDTLAKQEARLNAEAEKRLQIAKVKVLPPQTETNADVG